MAKKAASKSPPTPAQIALGKTIARVRQDAQMTQERLADLTELSVSQISRFESGRRRPYVDELLRLAHFLQIPASQLLGEGAPGAIRVTGIVGAGAVIEVVDDDAFLDLPEHINLPADGSLAALLVKGESQYPRFLDGEFILYESAPVRPAELVNQYAVVQAVDGRMLIKIIRPASGDRWELASHNAPPETAQLLAAWRYVGALWGPSVKTPEIAPPKPNRPKGRNSNAPSTRPKY